jgi:hypothetical protein
MKKLIILALLLQFFNLAHAQPGISVRVAYCDTTRSIQLLGYEEELKVFVAYEWDLENSSDSAAAAVLHLDTAMNVVYRYDFPKRNFLGRVQKLGPNRYVTMGLCKSTDTSNQYWTTTAQDGYYCFTIAITDAYGALVRKTPFLGCRTLPEGVRISPHGNIYVAGTTTCTTAEFAANAAYGPYATTCYVAKYDSALNLKFVTHWCDTASFEEPSNIVFDADDNALFTCNVDQQAINTVKLPPLDKDTAHATLPRHNCVMIVRVDSTGTLRNWRIMQSNTLDGGAMIIPTVSYHPSLGWLLATLQLDPADTLVSEYNTAVYKYHTLSLLQLDDSLSTVRLRSYGSNSSPGASPKPIRGYMYFQPTDADGTIVLDGAVAGSDNDFWGSEHGEEIYNGSRDYAIMKIDPVSLDLIAKQRYEIRNDLLPWLGFGTGEVMANYFQVGSTYRRFYTVYNAPHVYPSTPFSCLNTSGRRNIILLEELPWVLGNVDAIVGQSISVYPNPTSGLLTLQLPNTASRANVVLYNTHGGIVAQQPFSGERATLDCRGLALGMYTYVVVGDGKRYAGKVVVQ